MAELEFKYSWLKDPETCPIEDLKKQIEDLEGQVGFFDTKQLAIKKFINSVYGALGSKYFVAYNTAIAESITAQGRDLNHFSEISVNEYFEGIFQSNPELTLYYQWVHYNENGDKFIFESDKKPDDYYSSGKWEECKEWDKAVKKGQKVTPELKTALSNNSDTHCDWFMTKTTLAKKLGIDPERMKTFDISKGMTTKLKPLTGPEYDYLPGNQSLTVGGDTDSIYIELGRPVKWCKVPNERQAKFCVDLWDYSLGPYMSQKYEEYAKKYNCNKNIQNLELEKLSDVTMYFAKKRYAMSECWKEPNIYLPYMSKVLYKGIEIVKGSTSAYARECMDDFCRFILNWYGQHDEKIAYEEVMKKLKEYKRVFMTKSPDEICFGSSIGDYDKFILNDKSKLIIGEKCPGHIQAAGAYNFLLNQPKNKKFKVKYSPIRTADKVKWYYTTNKDLDKFAFVPGSFPAEFALPMDREVQFEKTILSFCNKVVSDILGYQPLTASLAYSEALF